MNKGFVVCILIVNGALGAAAELTKEDEREVERAVQRYVRAASAETDGIFVFHDEKLDKGWSLKWARSGLMNPAQLAENLFTACADFKETGGKSRLDVDVLSNMTESGWAVREVVIHSVNGQACAARTRTASVPPRSENAKAAYACPRGHYTSEKPGKCPKCGIQLARAP